MECTGVMVRLGDLDQAAIRPGHGKLSDDPPGSGATARSAVPDYLISNFESDGFSTQRFLDPV
jgi:hypothetical protein